MLDIYSFYLQPSTEVVTFKPAIELAAEFGAKYLVTMGADTDWSRQRDNFIRICEIAAAYGLTCIVEPAVIRPLANVAQTQRLIRDAGCTNAAICVDPWNFSRAGDHASDLTRIDPKLLPYAQICDGIIGPDEPNPALLGRMSPNRRCLLGQGDVPLADILDALPTGLPLSIELPPPSDRTVGAAEWAKAVLEDARGYLMRYYAGTGPNHSLAALGQASGAACSHACRSGRCSCRAAAHPSISRPGVPFPSPVWVWRKRGAATSAGLARPSRGQTAIVPPRSSTAWKE